MTKYIKTSVEKHCTGADGGGGRPFYLVISSGTHSKRSRRRSTRNIKDRMKADAGGHQNNRRNKKHMTTTMTISSSCYYHYSLCSANYQKCFIVLHCLNCLPALVENERNCSIASRHRHILITHIYSHRRKQSSIAAWVVWVEN